MVKHTQIRRQKPMNCLSMFGHFVELALKELMFWISMHRLVLMFDYALRH